MAIKRFPDEQPREGDIILHCAHPYGRGPFRWYWVQEPDGGPTEVEAPTGVRLQVHWIALCSDCEVESMRTGRDVEAFVRGHRVWSGDALVIQKDIVS